MGNIPSLLIILAVVACAINGHAYGRNTAPMPLATEREEMDAQRLGIVKKTRGMREIVRYRAEGRKDRPPVEG